MMVQEQLAQLNKISGVLGACLCSRDGKVLACNMPEIYEPETLELAARLIAEAFMGIESIREDVSEMDFIYQDYLCIVRPVGDARLLYVICEPEVKTPIVKLSLNVAAKKLAFVPMPETVDEGSAGGTSAQQVSGAPTRKPPDDSLGHQALTDSETLDPAAVTTVMKAIQDQLGQSMGESVGKIIVDTALDASGVNREAPGRTELRIALNELLNKALANVMGKPEAVRWLNELLERHGLARKGQ